MCVENTPSIRVEITISIGYEILGFIYEISVLYGVSGSAYFLIQHL